MVRHKDISIKRTNKPQESVPIKVARIQTYMHTYITMGHHNHIENSTTTTTYHNNSKQKEEEEEEEEEDDDGGQGELLYLSPEHAVGVVVGVGEDQENQSKKKKKKGSSMGLVEDIRRNLGNIKDKLLEKLAAAAVPADALENARHYLETVVRDVTVAAQGLTKDALHRIKTHLVDILPSLSPSLTRKMVDDAENEAANDGSEAEEEETQEGGNQQNLGSGTGKAPFVSPTSSLFASLRSPLSRL